MKRRAFLASIGFAIGSSATARAGTWPRADGVARQQARLPKDYYPFDVRAGRLGGEPFYHPLYELPYNLIYIDEDIRPIVKRINESGWVWTLESCQGGDGWGPDPLLRLAVHHGLAGRMFGLLARSAPVGDNLDGKALDLGIPRVTLYRPTRPPVKGWLEVRVTVSAEGTEASRRLDVFRRFADGVNR